MHVPDKRVWSATHRGMIKPVLVQRAVKDALNVALDRVGAQLISTSEFQFLQDSVAKFLPHHKDSYAAGPLPPGAEAYLRSDNPRLAEIRERLGRFEGDAIRHSHWTDAYTSAINIQYFRGDNPYVWQYQDKNAEINYVLTAYYLRTVDRLDLFDRLPEDGAFGVHTYRFDDGSLLSRDRLDSINEITFLQTMLDLKALPLLTVLDIGAGYGRLAHRMASALPNLDTIISTDAVALSSFLAEYYVRLRHVDDKARVVLLDEIEDALRAKPVHLATNIHSFSECSLATIRWWLRLLSSHRVRYLFIVPNPGRDNDGSALLSKEAGAASSIDFLPAILDCGYRRIELRPKYAAATIQKHGISPTFYHLFELAG